MNPLQKDPRREKLKSFAQYQTYCVIPTVVLAVLPHHAIDAQHRQNELLFRVIVLLLGIIAVVALEVKKQALKKAIAADDAEMRRQNPGSTPGVWPPPPL